MESLKNLNSKVVIITGASSGIGASAAVEFAKLGCRLTLTGRNKERLQETVQKCISVGLSEHDILSMVADVTKEEDIKSIIQDTISKFSTIHILVNNAGVGEARGALEMPVTCLDEMFNVHVRSVFQLVQLAQDHLKRNKDLAPHGVRVNSIRPGNVRTNIEKASSPMMDDAAVEKLYSVDMVNQQVLGRVGLPEEIAHAIVFLASDAASFIVGEQFNVDGGFCVTNN